MSYFKFTKKYLSYDVGQVIPSDTNTTARLTALGVGAETDKKEFEKASMAIQSEIAKNIIKAKEQASVKSSDCEDCDGDCEDCKGEAEKVSSKTTEK